MNRKASVLLFLNVFVFITLAGCLRGGDRTATPTPVPAVTATPNPPAPTLVISPSPTVPAIREIIVENNKKYGDLPEQAFDLCRPKSIPPGTKVPAIVFIHGGGWRTGDKASLIDECEWFARRGFIGITVNYRLAPENRWPAQIEDVQLAVRWLRANSELYRVNKNKIASYGGSAGGHLASMLGLSPTWDANGKYAEYAGRTNCVVDRYGPTNLTKMYYEIVEDSNSELGRNIIRDVVGGATPDTDFDLYERASPMYYVSPQSPPFYITHSTNDQLVPIRYGYELQAALQADGVEAKVVPFNGPGSSHGWEGLSDAEKEALLQDQVSFLRSCLNG